MRFPFVAYQQFSTKVPHANDISHSVFDCLFSVLIKDDNDEEKKGHQRCKRFCVGSGKKTIMMADWSASFKATTVIFMLGQTLFFECHYLLLTIN